MTRENNSVMMLQHGINERVGAGMGDSRWLLSLMCLSLFCLEGKTNGVDTMPVAHLDLSIKRFVS